MRCCWCVIRPAIRWGLWCCRSPPWWRRGNTPPWWRRENMPGACPRRTVCGGGDGISYGRGTPHPPITPSAADILHLALVGIRATYISPLCIVPTCRTGKGEVHLGRRYPTPRPRWATGDVYVAPVQTGDLHEMPRARYTSPADIPHLARKYPVPRPQISHTSPANHAFVCQILASFLRVLNCSAPLRGRSPAAVNQSTGDAVMPREAGYVAPTKLFHATVTQRILHRYACCDWTKR